MINKNSKVYIAGHNGMVGSSILRKLKNSGYKNIITRSKIQLNLLEQQKTYNFLSIKKPDIIIIAAAKAGGISANDKYRGEFLYENLQIQNNLIHGGYLVGVKKIIFLGSSCVYPRDCKQPIKEDYLLSGNLEKTNEPYAVAKIAGIKLIENYNKQYNSKYLCLMPCNLYGPNDNYDLDNSHFLPALIKKIYIAKINNQKSITLWGDGSPKRELMYVDDLAEAVFFFMNKKTNHHLINIGSNKEHTILEYAKYIKKLLNYNGDILFDKQRPNGTPRKIMNSRLAKHYGFNYHTPFSEGIKKTLDDYKKNHAHN